MDGVAKNKYKDDESHKIGKLIRESILMKDIGFQVQRSLNFAIPNTVCEVERQK